MVSSTGIRASQKIVFSSAEFLLSSLIKLCENSIDSIITRNQVWNEIKSNDECRDWTKSHFYVTLNNLKYSKYINVDSKNNSVMYTNKAKLKLVDLIAKDRVGVDSYRFISFDIPELLRKQRDAFRRTIKRMGFIQIQKSLWVINKDVGDLVELAALEYGIEKYVIYFVSAKSDIDGIIDRKFSKLRPNN